MLKYIFIFCFTAVLTAQTKRDTTLYKYGNIYMQEAMFNKLNPYKVYVIDFVTDSTVTKEAFSRNVEVELDSLQFIQIKTHIAKLTSQKYNPNKTAIFHLFSGDTNEANKIFHNERYWNFQEEHNFPVQSFILSEKDVALKDEPSNFFYLDERQFLEKLFFKNSIFNINHLIIKPDGNMLLIYGIQDIGYPLDIAVGSM
jgi:hypothetical protein